MSKQPWALILGAHSAFGEAIALELARTGMNIFGVDQRADLLVPAKIRALNREAEYFHAESRTQILEHIGQRLGTGSPGTLRVLLHTAEATPLPPLAGAEQVASRHDLERAAGMIGHELVFWVQDCLRAGLFDWGGRILALSSGKGPATALMEGYILQLAVDLAPAGITANSVVTGTRDIPGQDEANKAARRRNPHRRITVPDDVARCIAVICHPGTYWLTGNTLHVDGGENIVG